MNLEKINRDLRGQSPQQIIEWALSIANNPVLTTNFRPYEGAILQAVTSVKNVKVIWCDTGYNTINTYKHASELIEQLNLDIDIFIPQQTVAYRNVIMGIPDVDSPMHKLFSEQVKIEPFKRAMDSYQPDVWFTNIRHGQTEFRNSVDIVSMSKNGILKISPFYYWTDEQLDIYLKENKIPNEFKYFDPTKVLENRECGIHT